MAHEAQFLFPTCRAGGLDVRAHLRNTPRLGSPIGALQSVSPVRVELSVWAGGERLRHEPDYGEIQLGRELVIDSASVSELADAQGEERVVVARCRLEGGTGYFPQEHQLTYTRDGRATHLLYDQLPMGTPDKPASPIVLLAPKVWVGGDLNSFVAFASCGREGAESESSALELTIIDEGGRCLHHEVVHTRRSGVLMLDVAAHLELEHGRLDAPRLVNVVARGGAAQFAILTFVVNNRTGASLIEHSLSPHYYTQEGRDRLRAEALVFGNALADGSLV